MALNGPALASAIQSAIGMTAYALSSKNLAMGNAIVAHITTGIVAFAPGTVTGTVPPTGGPLSAGAASNGIIALIPSGLETGFASAFGTSTPQILGMADAISNHVSSMGKVSFSSGSITGVCTNTAGPPPTPGVFTGVGANGTISGLDGPTLASAIASGISQSSTSAQVTAMATAIVNHIMSNAVVTLAVVTGVCAAGGGSLVAGTAAGGTII